MSRRLLLSLATLVVLAVILAELLLNPPARDRAELWMIIAGPAVIAGAITPLLQRWVSSMASVAATGLTVGLCSLALGAVSSSAASNAMFVSPHDYRLFLVVLLMSSGIALVVGGQLTRPLARDVRRLGHVATTVADGDLSVRTGIRRADEVGATADAIDTMVVALARADAERVKMNMARQQLFSSIGHDLRTPLAAMRATVESIEDGVAADPRQSLAVIARQLRAMDAMLDQLIEFSRLESGHITTVTERVSLREIADECIEALTPLAATRHVHLQLVAHDQAIVTASPLELSRVLRNLVDNAVRHSPDGNGGSTVTIEIGLDASTVRSSVRLSVRDEGPGFAPDFREHAFEPFRRADPSRTARTGSSGLGLAICRAIVESLGGTIAIGPGPGGAIDVTMPCSPPRSPHPPLPAPLTEPSRVGDP